MVKRAPIASQNFLDRAIGAVAPGWAVQRMKARMAMAYAGGYFGGSKRNRPALSGWNPGASDADGDISPDLVDLRAYSRDLARTSAIAGGTVSNVVTNVVGTGLAAQPTPDAAFLGLDETKAKAWADQVQREWALWCDEVSCDITRTQNFYGLQSLVFRSVLESGDCFVIPTMAGQGGPYKLALQVIEADRVCNPNFSADTATLVQGVEMDANGAPVAYHVANQHPGARRRTGMSWTRIPAFSDSGRRNVLHLFDRRRPGQTRGVPYLAAVIEPLKQLKRYSDAEISAAVISAAFAVFVKMDPEGFESIFSEDERGAYMASVAGQGWNSSIPTASMDSPGKAINLLPGESIEAPDLGRPNAQFDPFFMAVCKQIGVGLELPVEVVLKCFNSSYSASRAALLDAWRFYRVRRDWLVTAFCQPIRMAWLEEAVARNRVRAPGFFADPIYARAWGHAVWTGDGPGSIDPLKEADAAEKRIALEISTRDAESVAYDGIPWEVKHRQRVREEAARRGDNTGEATGTANPGAATTYPSDPPPGAQ